VESNWRKQDRKRYQSAGSFCGARSKAAFVEKIGDMHILWRLPAFLCGLLSELWGLLSDLCGLLTNLCGLLSELWGLLFRAESVILKSNLPLIEFVNCVRNRQSIESNQLKNKQPWKNAATGAMVSACKNRSGTGSAL